MRKCSFCGFRADMMCIDCKLFFCYQHVIVQHTAWGVECDANKTEGHAFVPIIQKDSEGQVKATNPREAVNEGKRFARLQKKVFVLADNQDFNAITQLGTYYSIEVLGYRDAEISNAYVRGFVAEMLGSTDELIEDYMGGNITADQLGKAIAQAMDLAEQKRKNEERLQLMKGEVEREHTTRQGQEWAQTQGAGYERVTDQAQDSIDSEK